MPDSGPGGETDDPHAFIQIQVKESTKQTWEDYIAESDEHRGFSDLIRTSVNRRIGSTWELVTDDSDDPGNPEVLDALSDVTDRLEALETQLDDQDLAGRSPTEDDLSEQEIMRIARQCHDSLPVVKSADHLMQLTPLFQVSLDPSERASLTGAAQDISKVIDEPESHVRTALIWLERQKTANVQSTVTDGTRRWFEENENAGIDPLTDAEQAEKLRDELEIEDISNVLEFESASEIEQQ